MIGKQLAQYRIVGELGRGGMGIVYKAEDTKLDRTVAIKVLPPHALTNEDDRARFYREARAAAQLNHANICHVYQIDEAVPRTAEEITRSEIDEAVPDGEEGETRPFIAMEFIDGGTLQDQIQERPLKLPDCIRLATQVAEALKAAHSKGIVHRDIKSSNVMLDEHGNAKVVDFGLAKTAHSTMLTRMGSTLGAVAFMSPEQARGEDVDLRTDLWALGALIYELVAGRPPFAGDYEQAVVYSILNEEPEPLTAMRTGVPMDLEWIVRKCMAKSVDSRYQSAADLVVDLSMVKTDGSGSSRSVTAMSAVSSIAVPTGQPAAQVVKSNPWHRQPIALAAICLALAAGAVAGIFLSPSEIPEPLLARKLTLELPGVDSPEWPAIDNTGKLMAFVASDTTGGGQGLYLHDIETAETKLLVTGDIDTPLFSPDSRWLDYRDQGVQKILLPDGEPTTIRSDGANAFWENNNSLLFFDGGQLIRIGADGGEEQVVATADSTLGHRRFAWLATMLNDGYALAPARAQEGFDIVAVNLISGESTLLVRDANFPRYLSSGHLMYSRGSGIGGQVLVQPFDPVNMKLTGRAVPLPIGKKNVWTYTVGPDGSLLYRMDQAAGAENQEEFFVVDTSGERIASIPADRGAYSDPRVSPDGSNIAVETNNPSEGENDIILIDIETGRPERVTFQGDSDNPAWSPDGRYVYYDGRREQESGIYRRAADFTGVEELVIPGRVADANLSRDGNWLIYQNSGDIEAYSLVDSTSIPLVVNDGRQITPRISPDGAFVAYATNHLGGFRIFVKEFAGDAVIEVSEGPGPFRDPVWSPDGRYLYFIQRAGTVLLRVEVQLSPSFGRLSRPEEVAKLGNSADFALHPDSERLIVVSGGMEQADSASESKFRFVVNWFEELKRIAPPDVE